jgi:hypothetical protein
VRRQIVICHPRVPPVQHAQRGGRTIPTVQSLQQTTQTPISVNAFGKRIASTGLVTSVRRDRTEKRETYRKDFGEILRLASLLQPNFVTHFD